MQSFVKLGEKEFNQKSLWMFSREFSLKTNRNNVNGVTNHGQREMMKIEPRKCPAIQSKGVDNIAADVGRDTINGRHGDSH